MVQLTKQEEQILIKEIQIYKRPLNIGDENMKQFLNLVANDASHFFCVAQAFNNNKYILEYDKINDFHLQRVKDLKIDEYHELLVDVKSNQLTQQIKLIDLVNQADAKSSYFLLNNNFIMCVNRIIKFINSKRKPDYQKIKLACLDQLKFALNFVKQQISYTLMHFQKIKNFNMNSIKQLIHEFKLDSCFRNLFIKNFVIQLINDFLARQNYSLKDVLYALFKNDYIFFRSSYYNAEQKFRYWIKIFKKSLNFLGVCVGLVPITNDVFQFFKQFLSTILNQIIEGEIELSFYKKCCLGISAVLGATLNACCKILPVTLSCSVGLSGILTLAAGGIVGAGVFFIAIKLFEKIP